MADQLRSDMTAFKKILVTGGAGYVGAVLVPKLLAEGYEISVLDLYLFGDNVLDAVASNPALQQIKGDIRDERVLKRALDGRDAVIHLACISNDPSFELNPELGRSINYDAFLPLVRLSKQAGVRRFIYASSSSVYGIKDEPNVTEDLPLTPLTDYSKYKALCEDILLREQSDDFTVLILRPATVCGYSPRLRLDLTVNILTNHAVTCNKIMVFGGDQLRPNIHIDDITDVYIQSLGWPAKCIAGKIFNVGYENRKVIEIAEMVRKAVGEDVVITKEPTSDNRSYHISSKKIEQELGFRPRRTISDAIQDLRMAFGDGKVPDPMKDNRYYNVKLMQAVRLQ
jgi:nucleoside-diphosphate-sugar epimerase